VTASAIYEGWVHHRRHQPIEHRFRYRAWMLLLDLDELPQVLDGHPLWSARRPAPIRVRESDFLDPRSQSLAEAARELVTARRGSSPDGPIRLLACPRALGVGYNPVTFLYLHDRETDRLGALIAEVTSTPWGERHSYVAVRSGDGSTLRERLAKGLHTSPFMPIDQIYDVEANDPGATLRVRIASEECSRMVFEAHLSLCRRELTRASMTRVLLRYPPTALSTLARIYWNGFRLWSKGAEHHPHPAGGRPRERPSRPAQR
jgi:uncharacterized protein